MRGQYLEQLQTYRDEELSVLKRLNLLQVDTVMNVLEDARKEGHRIFIFGNGGSAATASHYAGDFNKGVNLFLDESENKYCFEALNDNIPTIMAVANDISYDEVFRYPLSLKMKYGDVVIGISGSGNSKNVINALNYANEYGGTTIAIVGYDGGILKKIANYSIHVDIDDMQISEDVHMVLDHMMMWVFTHGGK